MAEGVGVGVGNGVAVDVGVFKCWGVDVASELCSLSTKGWWVSGAGGVAGASVGDRLAVGGGGVRVGVGVGVGALRPHAASSKLAAINTSARMCVRFAWTSVLFGMGQCYNTPLRLD